MSFQTTIPCPACQSPIAIDSMLLLSGAQFRCSNKQCTTTISIDGGSIDKAKQAFNQFEALKQQSLEQAKSA